MKRYGLLLSNSGEAVDPVEIRLEIEAESAESAKLKVPKLYLDKGYAVEEVREMADKENVLTWMLGKGERDL